MRSNPDVNSGFSLDDEGEYDIPNSNDDINIIELGEEDNEEEE